MISSDCESLKLSETKKVVRDASCACWQGWYESHLAMVVRCDRVIHVPVMTLGLMCWCWRSPAARGQLLVRDNQVFELFKKKPKFPPVPDWKPSIKQSIDRIVDRLLYYTDRKRDFAVFEHGTCVILPASLDDAGAEAFAKEVLSKVFNYHPDMTPTPMDDGNILVRYNHPAVNVVLSDVTAEHWAEIDKNHQRALATSEVLITPLGSNVFDEFGKKALFGRCFMFMDAQRPVVVRIVRHAA